MATESTALAQGTPRPGAAGYETRDVNVRVIFGIVAGLICCGIIIHFALAAMQRLLLHTPAPTDAWNPVRVTARKPPSPRLQVSARLDLEQFRAWEEQQLTTYGWVNSTAGIVRVPIESAIDLVLQKGLPVRTNQTNGLGPSTLELIHERSQHRQPE